MDEPNYELKHEERVELSFRDQCAIAAMQALIINGKNTSAKFEEKGIASFAPRIARVAYKIADEMRKARLSAFT